MITAAAVKRTWVFQRRVVFFSLCLLWLMIAVVPMFGLLARNGWTIWELATFAVYVPLMAQVVFGFMLALTGYWILQRGGDPMRINRTLPANAPPPPLPATAIVMPIFHEDVQRVFQGLRVMYESLRKTGHGEACDFFILSDSSDPNYWIAEEMAWLQLCKDVDGFGRIFYRNRRVSLNQKSGNIADFCRRWGANYRYMIVLDADSIMTGSVFLRLVALMEKNQTTGIIQTNPQSVLGETLFQRILQFGGRVYGPVFMAGASYWQHDSGNYWGHNAIIRLKPFMEHCAMPELPKTGPLGRRILSHDTIEAALMRRAGYRVWFAYDLEGSYEESPPDLTTSLQRDRRWCRGNLQHLWFLLSRRLRGPSRLHILNGIMGYVSSPLWLLLLVLGTITAITKRGEPDGYPTASATGWFLLAYAMALLTVPKLLGLRLLFRSPAKLTALGGREKVLGGLAAEMLFSFLLAPILMLFHARFVLAAATGVIIKWNNQRRNADDGAAWGDYVAVHWANTVFIALWAALVAWLVPGLIPWMLFVFVGPLVAIPLARFTALKSLGQRLRSRGWFLIPEETNPGLELRELEQLPAAASDPYFASKPFAVDFGLLQVLLDPYVNAVHVSLLRQRDAMAVRTREYLAALGERLLQRGPTALTAQEKYTVLWDADSMTSLHRKLWRSPGSELAEWWQLALRHYHEPGAYPARSG